MYTEFKNGDELMKIIVDNTRTKIEGASSSALFNIDKTLAVETPNFWFSPSYKNGVWDGKTRFFDKRSNSFPTGLLDIVLDVIHEEYPVGTYEIVDVRNGKEFMLEETKDEIHLNGKTLRDYQVDSYNSVVASKIEGIPWQRGVLNLSTNSGKTVIAEAIVNDIYPMLQEKWKPTKDSKPVMPVVMFVTHSKEIAVQAKKSFEKDLGINVGFIGNGQWKVESVTIGIVGTLYSRYKKKKPEFLDLATRTIAFVADEVHHSASTSFFEVLSSFNNASVRIGLTGTVEDKDKVKKTRLLGIIGGILKKVSNDYLIKEGHSAKPRCLMIPVEYPDVDKIRLYGSEDGELEYGEMYSKGITNNMWRNYIIARICKHEVEEYHGQVLILVDRLEHGAYIQEAIEYVNCGIRHEFLYGDLPAEERQGGLDRLVNKEIDVLIATTILDEGVDVPNINAIIYARGGKSVRKILQGIGRGLRRKADGSEVRVYDFIDLTGYTLAMQSERRLEILKGEKFKCKKLTTEELGITENDFKAVLMDLDTTYDSKYVRMD